MSAPKPDRISELVDMLRFCGAHGDVVTMYFLDDIEPQLERLSVQDLWIAAGLLLYLDSTAEARVVTEWAVERAYRALVEKQRS
jgi:hypothetical protein